MGSSTASLEAYLSKYGISRVQDVDNVAGQDAAEPALELRLKQLDEQLEASLRRSSKPLFQPLSQHDTNKGQGVAPPGHTAHLQQQDLHRHSSLAHHHHHHHHQQQQQQQLHQQQQCRKLDQVLTPSQTASPSPLTASEKLRQEWEQLKARHASITSANAGQWAAAQQPSLQLNGVVGEPQKSTGLVLGILSGSAAQRSPRPASASPVLSPTHHHQTTYPLDNGGRAAPIHVASGPSYRNMQALAAPPSPHDSFHTAPSPHSTHSTSTITSRPYYQAQQHAQHAPAAIILRVSTGVQTEESSFGGGMEARPQQSLHHQRQQLLEQVREQEQQERQQQQQQEQQQQQQQAEHILSSSSHCLQQALQDALLAIISQPPPHLLPILSLMLQQQSPVPSQHASPPNTNAHLADHGRHSWPSHASQSEALSMVQPQQQQPQQLLHHQAQQQQYPAHQQPQQQVLFASTPLAAALTSPATHCTPQQHQYPAQQQQPQQVLPASMPLAAALTTPSTHCTPQQHQYPTQQQPQQQLLPASTPLAAALTSPPTHCAPQQHVLLQSASPGSVPSCSSQPSHGHYSSQPTHGHPAPIPLLSAPAPRPTPAHIAPQPSSKQEAQSRGNMLHGQPDAHNLCGNAAASTGASTIPLLPSASPPQPTTPDPATYQQHRSLTDLGSPQLPWAMACAQDQGTRAGWRAAAGLVSAAVRSQVGGSPEVVTQSSTIPCASASPQSLVVAAPAASAHPRLPAHSGVGASGQASRASAECGAHASLPPLPPLLAARLADHLRRKERRQLHPQAGSCSPPSSVAFSVAESCHSPPMHRSQNPAYSSKARAARPARWRERVQLQAPQTTACGSSSEESL